MGSDLDGIDLPAGVRTARQRGNDLGARLEHAFATLLPEAGDHAVIFGADCPRLEPAILGRAFEALARATLVLAPAHDGGYALIGLARPMPELFRGIAWSSEHV